MSLKWWHSAFLSFLQNLTWYLCEGVAERLGERMLLLNGLMNTRFIDCYQYIWLHHSQEMIGYIIRYITTWEHWRLIQHAKKVYSHLLVVDALISFIQSIGIAMKYFQIWRAMNMIIFNSELSIQIQMSRINDQFTCRQNIKRYFITSSFYNFT